MSDLAKGTKVMYLTTVEDREGITDAQPQIEATITEVYAAEGETTSYDLDNGKQHVTEGTAEGEIHEIA